MSISFWINGTYILLATCAVFHSIGGEFWLLRPLFQRRGNKVLDNRLARRVLRYGWHMSSLGCLLIAGLLAALVDSRSTLADLGFLITGGLFLALGLLALMVSRGRHYGWPVLVLIGVFAIAAARAL